MEYSGYKFRYYCKTLGCDFCRRKRIVELETEAQDLFASRPAGHLFFLTICLPSTQDRREIPAIIRMGKRDLRNLIARCRAAHPKAQNCRLFGFSEIGYCPTENHLFLGSDKVAQLKLHGVDPWLDHTYSPHFHLLVDTAGANIANLIELCERKWPASKAVHHVSLRHPIEQSIKNITHYSTNMEDYYTINRVDWSNNNYREYIRTPNDELSLIYSMLDCNHNFQLLKVHVRPVRSRTSIQQIKHTIAKHLDYDDFEDDLFDHPIPITL